MKRSKFVWIIVCVAVALCAIGLAACATIDYSDNREPPEMKKNEVLFIERNRLSFALGMEIDDADVIARCNCTFSDENGDEFKVTSKKLKSGEVEYESFDLDSVGSNKQIRIAYNGAVNYIYYDVNDYTANFYLDEDHTELYQTVKASAQLSDTLGLSVWVNMIQCNFSTDEVMREYDADRAMRFDGWYDLSGNRATGLYTLAPPVFGNERVIDFRAGYISEAELADLELSYDNSGRRVFSGYVGSGDRVHVPEGVTYIDIAKVFENGCSFKSLSIPSTAKMDVPFLSGHDTVELESITVNPGNTLYSSYNGALYSKDYSTLYLMPASCKNTDFHSGLTVVGSYACTFWRIRELVIPESVVTLQHYCFAYSQIADVHGLDHVKTIKTGAFFGSKVKLYHDGDRALYIALDGADSGKFVLSMIMDKNITEYTLISGTVGIAGDVFRDCKFLTKVDFGNELRSIGASAFSGCTSLESIAFPTTLEKLGSEVFYGCSALKSVSGLTDITFVDDDGNEYEHTLPTSIFRECSELESLTLPDGLVNISPNAMRGCVALKTISMPDTVAAIGSYGLYGCSSLTELELPKSLKRMGTYALASTGLVGIDLSVCEQLTTLPDNCFRNSKLKEIVIPDRIHTIPMNCFYLAQSLKTVTLGDVTVIDDQAFAGCRALSAINLDGVESIGYRAFQQCNAFVDVVIPDSVKHIGGQAFMSCSALKSLTLGKGVETFGDYSFDPDGVTFTALQQRPAVYTCNKIEVINVAEGNPYFKSIDGVLYGRSIGGVDYGEGGVLYIVPMSYRSTSFVSADSTRVVAPYAAHYQAYLTKAVLNEGVENIGMGAFYRSTKLTEVYLPSTVTNIGASILLSCSAVKTFSVAEANKTYSSNGNLVYKDDSLVMYLGLNSDVNIKEGITKIGYAVFMNSAAITEISIPDSVVEIDGKAFSGCSKLSSIHIGSGLRYLDSTAFALLQSLETITVSEDNPYFIAENNILYSKDGKSLILAAAKNGMTELNIKDGVTEICDYAFSYHQTLASAVLPHSVRTIGDYAFYECRGIEYLYCSESLESIGAYAFAFDSQSELNVDNENRFCDTLKVVLFYGNLKRIGDFAFNGQFGIEYTFYKMTIAELTTLLSGLGKNSVFITLGCKNKETGSYYNNYGFGIIRALYSAVPPTIDYNGYEWFYMEDGTPTIYQQIPERDPA